MAADTLDRIRSIVERQFDEEIDCKKREVELITRRIHSVKSVLDQLRAAIISKYYAVPDFLESSAREHCVHPTVRAYFAGKTLPSTRISPASYELPVKLGGGATHDVKSSSTKPRVKSMEKVRFVMGNVSRYIGDDDLEDSVSHIWLTYVRLHPHEKSDIREILSKVRFFLHPSYVPHDVVDVAYPFQLKRKGWGEFSLRAQLHFVDPLNKPVDVIHSLKLDKHKTGLQTFGGETIFEVMLLIEKDLELPAQEIASSSSVASEPQIVPEVNVKTEPVEHTEDFQGHGRVGLEEQQPVEEDVEDVKPVFIDLKAHGHDYFLVDDARPIKHEPEGDTDPCGQPNFEGTVEQVRTLKGESLLNPRSSTSDRFEPVLHQSMTSSAEAAANWQTSLTKVNYDRDVHAIIDDLAQGHFALVGCRPVPDLCFQVASIAEYFSYPIGKRRAVEWFRAGGIRRALHQYGGLADLPSTRKVLLYLRTHGFTPLHPDTDVGPSDQDEHTQIPTDFNSYSVIDLGTDLQASRSVSMPVNSETSAKAEVEVDIETLEEDVEPVDGQADASSAIADSRLRFVYEAMEEIVDADQLPTDNLEQLDDLLKVMAAAMTSFARQLLRRSLAEAFVRNSSSHRIDKVLPADVHKAVSAHEQFDFLGNDGLGRAVEDCTDGQ